MPITTANPQVLQQALMSMSDREFRKQEFMDLLSHFRDVYKLSCKTMVVIKGAEFAVVLMEACNHVCRYFTSVINRNILIITVANVIFICYILQCYILF